MNDVERAIFEEAIIACGSEHQQKKLLEEMAELQKEICKHWDGAPNLAQIADEMADVEIMLDQMKLIFHNSGLVHQRREYKVERLLDRITKGVEGRK